MWRLQRSLMPDNGMSTQKGFLLCHCRCVLALGEPVKSLTHHHYQIPPRLHPLNLAARLVGPTIVHSWVKYAIWTNLRKTCKPQMQSEFWGGAYMCMLFIRLLTRGDRHSGICLIHDLGYEVNCLMLHIDCKGTTLKEHTPGCRANAVCILVIGMQWNLRVISRIIVDHLEGEM